MWVSSEEAERGPFYFHICLLVFHAAAEVSLQAEADFLIRISVCVLTDWSQTQPKLGRKQMKNCRKQCRRRPDGCWIDRREDERRTDGGHKCFVSVYALARTHARTLRPLRGANAHPHPPQQSKTDSLLPESPWQPGSSLQHLLTSLQGDEVKNRCENVWSEHVELFFSFRFVAA